ncbi:MAG: PIN domain-containing protein [Candidatus Riflebacteria bacterium]|nr:PIN domain-containing protein [Candidatus Riflebacteria bacterium]
MNVLVDTSIWSLVLRRRRKDLSPDERSIGLELTELIKEGRAVLIGAIRQEILSGVRERATFDRLRDHLRSFDDEMLSFEDYEEAAACGNRCRAAGVSGSMIDFLLCAVARRRGLSVFTTDAAFERYSRHLHIRLHHPAGQNDSAIRPRQ